MGVKKSVEFEFKGQKLNLFYMSELCAGLGVQPQTIRKWEIAGTIPKTPFRDKSGKRLYLREHIDCIVEAAEACHIGQGRTTYNSFKRRVYNGFNKINEKYGLVGGNG